MKFKNIMIVITTTFVTLGAVTVSYGQIFRGQDAFYEYRISPSNHVRYYIHTNNTNNYSNHTSALNIAVRKFDEIDGANIGFSQSDNDTAVVEMDSCSSSKEEWLGLTQTNYSDSGEVIRSQVFLNDYSIKKFNLTKEQLYEVSLHELGHSFGLMHQDQIDELDTIMCPYISGDRPGVTDLRKIDKENIKSTYPLEYDFQNHWAENAIQLAMDEDWVAKSNTFRPNDPITRAEFVKVFNRVFGLSNKSGKVFNDTINHWAKDEIDIAVTNGVCSGKSLVEFKPNDFLTREEAAVMISNYKKIADENYDKLNNYKDKDQVSIWAKSSVEGVIEKGYMGAGGSYFNPKGKITRAEAVVALSRVK